MSEKRREPDNVKKLIAKHKKKIKPPKPFFPDATLFNRIKLRKKGK